MLPFDFDPFEKLYDLRQMLQTTAVHRLCDGASKIGQLQLDALGDIWLVGTAGRSQDAKQVAQWNEAFRCTLVTAAGNAEMARVHRDVTDRIRVIRKLDFNQLDQCLARACAVRPAKGAMVSVDPAFFDRVQTRFCAANCAVSTAPNPLSEVFDPPPRKLHALSCKTCLTAKV